MCLAIPGQVLSIEDLGFGRRAQVRFGGVVRAVDLAFTPDAKEGDYILTHVGFSLSILNEAEAKLTLDLLRGETRE